MNIHRDCPTLGAAPTAHHPVIAPNKKPARKPGRFTSASHGVAVTEDPNPNPNS